MPEMNNFYLNLTIELLAERERGFYLLAICHGCWYSNLSDVFKFSECWTINNILCSWKMLLQSKNPLIWNWFFCLFQVLTFFIQTLSMNLLAENIATQFLKWQISFKTCCIFWKKEYDLCLFMQVLYTPNSTHHSQTKSSFPTAFSYIWNLHEA